VEPTDIDATLDQIRAALEGNHVEEAIAALIRLRPADRAEAFADLPDDDQATLLPRLDISTTADMLEELEDPEAADAARILAPDRLADVLDEMEPDQAADILGDLSPARAARALAEMEDADDVLPLLGHPDESAGGLMTTDYIALRRFTTAAQALEFLRDVALDQSTPYYLYVVDRNRKLLGVVGLRELITAKPDTVAEDLMNRDVMHVTTGTDQEEVARIIARYNLAALPVVNGEGVLQGVVTHDDVLDVLQAETTEDVLHFGAIESGPISDRPYWSQKISQVVRSRFVWLLALFVAETLTGTVLRRFSGELEAVLALAFFVPLIIGTGGNAGSQTVTTVVRALALKEVARSDALRVLGRELVTAVLLGLMLGIVAFFRVELWGVGREMALVVALTIVAVVLWANVVGSLIPILAESVGIDPTVMSAPLLATLVDATGLVIYFSIAAAVLTQI
jgi:magnesium transporter